MVVTERTAFSAELQAVMAAKGATEWAKVLDVDRTTVHKWWSGDAFPRGRQLDAIARETGRRLAFVTDTQRAAPPDWVERLERKLDILVARAGVDPVDAQDKEEARRLIAAALALGQPRTADGEE